MHAEEGLETLNCCQCYLPRYLCSLSGSHALFCVTPTDSHVHYTFIGGICVHGLPKLLVVLGLSIAVRVRFRARDREWIFLFFFFSLS